MKFYTFFIILLLLASLSFAFLPATITVPDFKTKAVNGVKVSLGEIYTDITPTGSVHYYWVQTDPSVKVASTLSKNAFLTKKGTAISDVNLVPVNSAVAGSNKSGNFLDITTSSITKAYDTNAQSNYLLAVSTPAFVDDAFNFTAFGATIDPSLSACGVINTPGTYVLTQSITGNGPCLNIQADSVVIDGTIANHYNISASGSGTGYGDIDLGASSHADVSNFRLINANVSSYLVSGNPSIYANDVHHYDGLSMENDSVGCPTDSASVSCLALFSYNSNLTFNNITVYGSGTKNIMTYSGANTSLTNSTLVFNGTQVGTTGVLDIGGQGGRINNASISNTVISSTIAGVPGFIVGTGNTGGALSKNITFFNNTINVSSIGASINASAGITDFFLNFTNNTVNTTGAAPALFLFQAFNSTFSGNILASAGNALNLTSSSNNTFTNNTFLGGATDVIIGGAAPTSDNNSFYWNNFNMGGNSNPRYIDAMQAGGNNTFNTSISGIGQGNWYADLAVIAGGITYVNGWGTAGVKYPYNATNTANFTQGAGIGINGAGLNDSAPAQNFNPFTGNSTTILSSNYTVATYYANSSIPFFCSGSTNGGALTDFNSSIYFATVNQTALARNTTNGTVYNNTNYATITLTSSSGTGLYKGLAVIQECTATSSINFATSSHLNSSTLTINDSIPNADAHPELTVVSGVEALLNCSGIDGDGGTDIIGVNLTTNATTVYPNVNGTSDLRFWQLYNITNLTIGKAYYYICSFTDKNGTSSGNSSTNTNTTSGPVPGTYGGANVSAVLTVDTSGVVLSISNTTIFLSDGSILNMSWSKLLNYPSACSAGTAVTQVGASLICSSFLTSFTETDPFWSGNSSTVARIGTCPSGQVVQNTTTGGVQCIAGSTGTVTQITAGNGLTGGVITTSGTIALNDTGASAGTYGGNNQTPTFTIDSTGRITSVGNGTIDVSDGSITNLSWNKLLNFPSACSAGNAVTQIGASLVCSSFLTSFTEIDPLWSGNFSNISTNIINNFTYSVGLNNNATGIGNNLSNNWTYSQSLNANDTDVKNNLSNNFTYSTKLNANTTLLNNNVTNIGNNLSTNWTYLQALNTNTTSLVSIAYGEMYNDNTSNTTMGATNIFTNISNWSGGLLGGGWTFNSSNNASIVSGATGVYLVTVSMVVNITTNTNDTLQFQFIKNNTALTKGRFKTQGGVSKGNITVSWSTLMSLQNTDQLGIQANDNTTANKIIQFFSKDFTATRVG